MAQCRCYINILYTYWHMAATTAVQSRLFIFINLILIVEELGEHYKKSMIVFDLPILSTKI